jgi:hypothetical protein
MSAVKIRKASAASRDTVTDRFTGSNVVSGAMAASFVHVVSDALM